ncbi:PepSY-associated TM helix domain-containing protein [Geofilum sp. OHC36d9]|uniref:PepSY-associated TM helix domain-containing protein n=1 Tax=Geofilum sp. OHC36d9 TaxID=3458413 RepID=UPI0040347BE1
MKHFFVKLHLILGLLSGIIVFIMTITGALYTFKTEIESITQAYKKVSVENRSFIPPSQALEIGEKANPGVAIHGVIYRDSIDALEVVYYQANPLYYGASYLNPYSGEVIKTVNFINTFFGFVLRGHTSLWLPSKIGKPIVAIASIIFLLMIITGLFLWWPRKTSTGNFTFTKGASSSLKKMEMHKIVGFYAGWIGLILVLTGMTWLFDGFDKITYKAMGGKKEVSYSVPKSDLSTRKDKMLHQASIDILYNRIKTLNPALHFIEIHAVKDSSSSVLVELNRDPTTHWKMDYLFFDQYTLAPIKPKHIYGSFEDAQIPDKIKRMYYDIHTGSIGGIFGKIIVFLGSLFCASLPVTGFLMWWKRKKEKRTFVKELNL